MGTSSKGNARVSHIPKILMRDSVYAQVFTSYSRTNAFHQRLCRPIPFTGETDIISLWQTKRRIFVKHATICYQKCLGPWSCHHVLVILVCSSSSQGAVTTSSDRAIIAPFRELHVLCAGYKLDWKDLSLALTITDNFSCTPMKAGIPEFDLLSSIWRMFVM